MIWQTRDNLELYLRGVKGKAGEWNGGIWDGGSGGSGSGPDIRTKLFGVGWTGTRKLCTGWNKLCPGSCTLYICGCMLYLGGGALYIGDCVLTIGGSIKMKVILLPEHQNLIKILREEGEEENTYKLVLWSGRDSDRFKNSSSPSNKSSSSSSSRSWSRAM